MISPDLVRNVPDQIRLLHLGGCTSRSRRAFVERAGSVVRQFIDGRAHRRSGDACKLSIASNASYISLYCFAADAAGSVAERYVDRLPKASIGKACVRFKKLADLDEKALVPLIEETAE